MGVNLAYPAPQADRLDRLAVVVDAVDVGADTSSGIAAALDMVDRQGAYYANAAAYLGLIEDVPGTSPQQWRLTDDGRAYAAAGGPGRLDLLTGLVAQVPGVQVYLEPDGGLAAVKDLYSGCDLDAQTATRRAQTAAAWAALLLDQCDPDTFVRDGATVRAAAARIAAELAAARVAATPAPPPVCSSCWMQLPSTLVCDNC